MPLSAWLTPALISRLEALQLSVKWVRAGSRLGGRYAVNRRGSSVEFADYAAYAPGDDIRSIDWNLYARLDKLFVKTYKEEIALTVELLVDATASMALPAPEKFRRATRLAVCLGYIGLADQHHVRLSWIRPGPVLSGPWWRRRAHLAELDAAAEAATPGGQVAWADWMRRATPMLRIRGGQALVITDGMVPPADFFRAMHELAVRNVEIKVIQVLTRDELRPGARLARGGVLVDAETGQTHQLAYRPAELERAVANHNELLMRFCKREGILFAQHQVEQPLEEFLTRTLPHLGFLE